MQNGLVDIVETDSHGGSNVSWKVLLNQGSSWSTSFQYWVNNASMGDARLDRNGDDVELLDVTGDSLPDVVMAATAAEWRVWRNTGSGFNTTHETWADLGGVHNDINLGNTGVTLADATGDGLPDIIRSYTNGQQQWDVFRNTGSSWSTTPEVWSYNNIPVGLDNPGVRVMDVNGDGMADVVRTVYELSNGLSTWFVWKSTGTGWGDQTIWFDDYMYVYFQRDDVTVADANGDGLPDIVKSFDNGNSDEWKVLYNRGGSWYNAWQTWIPTSGGVDIDVYNSNTRLVDVNGDGMADILRGYSSGQQGQVTWKVWKNNGVSPHLLATVRTSQGAEIKYDYMKASTLDNTGPDNNPDLPFPLWIVQTMTVNNGMTNSHETEDVTTYSYQNGLYKWQDREFRGFGNVSTIEPNGSKKQYVFNQDDATKGRVAEVSHTDASNNPYTKVEHTWSNSSANGIYTVNLTQEKNYTYDGSASNPKISQTDYAYDSYGNVMKKSELGDTSISGDERYTYNEYTFNTTNWIVNTPKKTYLNAANDTTKVSESTFYYDGNTGLSDPPTDGDLTKEAKWSNGVFTTDPTTTYTYDAFGNQTTVTDANNHTTTTAYESTGTYPTSITNAKNQVTSYQHDLGTGNLLTKVDPNDIVYSYTYDAYGRKKRESRRAGVNDYPLVNYTYDIDGYAPEGVLITKRHSGATATNGDLKEYTFTDGLGRKIQTRIDAEDTTKQIITDTFYDANGKVTKETVPYLATASNWYSTPNTGAKFTQTTYDAVGRATTITNPKADNKTIAYDHWKETVVDENGNTKREFKNAHGKIVKVEEVNDASTYTTMYTYDARNLLTAIVDHSSNQILFTYDALGNKVTQTDPDMGEWSYSYDKVGNLTSQTDARNITTARVYDELDRLVEIDYPTDTDIVYTYDVDTLGKSKRIGTLANVTDQAGTVQYTYNDYLLKTSEKRVYDGTSAEITYAYDNADRLIQRKNPDGKRIQYAYNAQGQIESVKEHTYNHQGEIVSTKDILDDVDYNALGKITSNEFANGLTTNYTYNTDDFRLNRIQTGGLQDFTYTYDNVGNVLSVTDAVDSKTQTFTYDDLDRLATASETSGYNYAFEYDAIGNITEFTNGSNTIDYTYGSNAGPHAMTSSTETAPSPLPTATSTPQPTLTPTPSHNLVPNGSFEVLNSGWADPWTKVSNFFSIDTNSNGNDGTNSLHLVPNSSAAWAFSDNIDIDPAKSYVWKQFVKVEEGDGEFGYYIDEYDAQGNWISGQWKGQEGPSDTWYRNIAYTPTGSSVASIGLQYYAVANSTFDVYIDSVSLSVDIPLPNHNPRQPMVSFTFDDGLTNTYINAAPILEKYGIRGTVYVPPDCIDEINNCQDNVAPGEEFMDWGEVVALQNLYNWEIGSHTSSHLNISTLTGQQLFDEIVNPISIFQSHGITVNNFASPQGDYDSEALAIVAKYYKSHRGFHNKGYNPWPGDPMTLNVLPVQNGSPTATPFAGITVDQVKAAIDTAINNKTWIILVFHGIKPVASTDVSDFEYSNADLDAIAAYVRQRQSTGDIAPVTVEEGLHINETNMLSGTFSSGVPTGWYASNSNITANTANNGSLPGATDSLAFASATSGSHLLTPAITVSTNTRYGFKGYVNNANLTAGELGYYVDEYDSVGNWISGRWLGGIQPTYVAVFSRVYQPSSPQVATFKLQTYHTGNSVGTSYIDNYELYAYDN